MNFKNTAFILFCFLLITNVITAQIEGQNFCTPVKGMSYFPLHMTEKVLAWSDTYYIEKKDTLVEKNGKRYAAFVQTWEKGSVDTLYLRVEGKKVYQLQKCCKEETLRWDEDFKVGHKWSDAGGEVNYEVISFEGKLTTPVCDYTNLLIIHAVYSNGSEYDFYYSRGFGYVGATITSGLLSFAVPKKSLLTKF